MANKTLRQQRAILNSVTNSRRNEIFKLIAGVIVGKLAGLRESGIIVLVDNSTLIGLRLDEQFTSSSHNGHAACLGRKPKDLAK